MPNMACGNILSHFSLDIISCDKKIIITVNKNCDNIRDYI